MCCEVAGHGVPHVSARSRLVLAPDSPRPRDRRRPGPPSASELLANAAHSALTERATGRRWDRARGCHHRPRRGPLPPDHRGPGDHPAGALCAASGSQCSPGAPTAPSAASLPWTARANPGTLSSSTGPKGCVLVGGRERARATSSVSGRRRRTVRAPPGGSLVPGDAGGTGTLALRRRHRGTAQRTVCPVGEWCWYSRRPRSSTRAANWGPRVADAEYQGGELPAP
jgi:hypothetical protein